LNSIVEFHLSVVRVVIFFQRLVGRLVWGVTGMSCLSKG
jgi:hypothetical protein